MNLTLNGLIAAAQARLPGDQRNGGLYVGERGGRQAAAMQVPLRGARALAKRHSAPPDIEPERKGGDRLRAGAEGSAPHSGCRRD